MGVLVDQGDQYGGMNVPDVGILLAHSDHDTLVTWTTND
jgi:hypothetical protein